MVSNQEAEPVRLSVSRTHDTTHENEADEGAIPQGRRNLQRISSAGSRPTRDGDDDASSSAPAAGPGPPQSPQSPPHLPVDSSAGSLARRAARPPPSPLGSPRAITCAHSSLHSPAHSFSSIASTASQPIAASFAYGLYGTGPASPRTLPSPYVPEDDERRQLPPGLSDIIVTQETWGPSKANSGGAGREDEGLEVAGMPLGILNTRDGTAPGTVVAALQDKREKSNVGIAVTGSMSPENVLDPNLKYDRTGKEPVLLIPQPTDDPNDPLNWPLWRRDVILAILSFMSVIASTLSPLLAADTFSIYTQFILEPLKSGKPPAKYTITQMALLTGYHLLGVGLAGFLFVASARVWGKRHLYLLGCILIIASSAWGGATGLNYGSLLAARIVQGVGLAPFEALVNASVADLYFVHERGVRMAISNMALFGGAFFTPIIVGKMSDSIGWQWSFYFVAIFAGVAFPFIFFFVPETAFRRDHGSVVAAGSLGNPHVAEGPSQSLSGNVASVSGAFNTPMAGAATDEGLSEYKEIDSSAGSAKPRPAKMSFARSLLPFSGRKTDESIWKLVLRPFPLFFHPAVLWACLIQGAIIGWTVLIGVVLAVLFAIDYSEVSIGYMYTGPFLGAIVGFLLSGLIADASYKLMTRWNKGVYEPEFRLVLVIPQLILGCAGLYGFGAAANGTHRHWFAPTFCFALEVAGMVMGAVASALYIADAHNDIAVEAFTCLLIFKNIFSFGLTYGAFDWLTSPGTFDVFIIVGSVQAGICLLTIPMYIFGKRNRAFFGKHNILKYLGLW